MKTFRLIRSPAAAAAQNMSFDEAMFSRFLRDGIPVLRVYRWRAPSFTWGVSQKPDDELDLARCAAEGVETAGRMTGGGVLFHHDEITYSFACSKEDVGEPRSTLVSYRGICGFLIRFYRSLGLDASFALESPRFAGRSAPHGLCSASHEKFDLVIADKKIGGNAQKRSRQAIFQHGSVPCGVDWGFVGRFAKSLPPDIAAHVTTLSEQMAKVPGKDELERKLIDAFAAEFNVCFEEIGASSAVSPSPCRRISPRT